MKLATLKDGSRDGQLVVVSRDLASAHYASGIASRLQQVLDDWNFLSPQLEDLSTTLNHGRARHAFAFDPALCMAPLPRACQWICGVAATDPPALAQRASDDLHGARDPIVRTSDDRCIDFEAGLAVVTGDVPMGADATAALDAIRLVMLANDQSLRQLIAPELARGFGFVQSKPATAFSPVAVTPDELGAAWQGGRVHLGLETAWNGRRVGLCDAGAAMRCHFGELIAQVCGARRMRAGSIVGSGAIGAIDGGVARGEFMNVGDTVRIEMTGPSGSSVFGAIEQRVVAAG